MQKIYSHDLCYGHKNQKMFPRPPAVVCPSITQPKANPFEIIAKRLRIFLLLDIIGNKCLFTSNDNLLLQVIELITNICFSFNSFLVL